MWQFQNMQIRATHQDQTVAKKSEALYFISTCRNSKARFAAGFSFLPHLRGWQGQRESNPQPSVLETDALPIELYPYILALITQ